MATAGGANTVVDGLVFGYDTGYPLVSGSSDTYKFNRGEPTENLAPNPYFIDGNGDPTVSGYGTFGFSHDNTIAATSLSSAVGNGYSAKVVKNTTTNGTIVESVTIPALSNGDTVVVSWYARGYGGSEDQTCQTHCYINSSEGAISTGTYSTVTSEWKRFYHVLTWNKQVSSYTSVNSYFYSGFGTGTEFLVSNPQVELYKSHATPFTTGTRSASGSLIDLTRTTDIDLSNVSFDSNAQMTFDGTDDIIELDVDDWIRTKSVVSFEGVFYLSADTYGAPWGILTATSPVGDADGFWWHVRYPALSNALLFRVEDSDGEHGYNGTELFQLNSWYHVVTVVGNDMVKIYSNGELLTSSTPTFQWSNINSDTATLTIAKSWTSRMAGNIPIFKLYDRELTDSEILQNYNAVKERFSL